ncbi:MAG: DUF2169 domain-containing protein [Polyangiaceae bacterium]
MDRPIELPYATLLWQPRANTWLATITCKVTYRIEQGELVPAQSQEAVQKHDTFWDDDPLRSLTAFSESAPTKPRAEILVVGHAYSPTGKPVRSLVARVAFDTVDKSIEVVADRAVGPDGTVYQGPRFTRMPLTYERTSGGPGTMNPVGVRSDTRDPYGRLPLPNITRVGQGEETMTTTEPVGLGPLSPSWPGRAEKCGYKPFDVGALEGGPLPEDLELGFFNLAPPDQQLDSIADDAALVLEGLHPQHGVITTKLPGLRPKVTVERRSGVERPNLRADTIWIDTDRGLVFVLYRAHIQVDHRAEQLRIKVELERPRSSWRTVQHELAPRETQLDALEGAAVSALGTPAQPPPEERTAARTVDAPRTRTGLPFASGGRSALPFVGGGALPASSVESTTQIGASPANPPGTGTVQMATGLPFGNLGTRGSPTGEHQLPSSRAGSSPELNNAPSNAASGGLRMGAPPIPPLAPPAPPIPPLAPPMAPLAPPPPPLPPSPPPVTEPTSPWAVPSSSSAAPTPLAPAAPAPAPLPPPLPPAPLPAPRPMTFGPIPAPPASSPGGPISPPLTGAPAMPPAPAYQNISAPSAMSSIVSSAAGAAAISPQPPAVVKHSSAATLGGLTAASNAAADTHRGGDTSGPAPRIIEGDVLHLLWFKPDVAPRVRRKPEWKKILDKLEQGPFDPEIDEPSLADDPAELEDRREIYEVLAHGTPAGQDSIDRALLDAVRSDGRFAPQLLLLLGEVRFDFDEIELLKATVSAATPFATPDSDLKKNIEQATAFLATPGLVASADVATTMTTKVRDAFAGSSRTVPATYLDDQTERALLERRAYQKRSVFGEPHLRGLFFFVGSTTGIPTYFADALGKKLPLFRRLRVRMLVEAHFQADQYESHSAALKVVAIARIVR